MPRTPRDLADRMAARRRQAKAENGYVRETYTPCHAMRRAPGRGPSLIAGRPPLSGEAKSQVTLRARYGHPVVLPGNRGGLAGPHQRRSAEGPKAGIGACRFLQKGPPFQPGAGQSWMTVTTCRPSRRGYGGVGEGFRVECVG